MPRVGIVIALAVLAGASASPAATPRDVAYTVSPELSDGELRALDVTMRLTAPSTGVTQLQLPDNDSGASGLWRYLDDLEVVGATSVKQDGPARRIVTSRANAPLVVRYRVISAFDHDPGADELDT